MSSSLLINNIESPEKQPFYPLWSSTSATEHIIFHSIIFIMPGSENLVIQLKFGENQQINF